MARPTTPTAAFTILIRTSTRARRGRPLVMIPFPPAAAAAFLPTIAALAPTAAAFPPAVTATAFKPAPFSSRWWDFAGMIYLRPPVVLMVMVVVWGRQGGPLIM